MAAALLANGTTKINCNNGYLDPNYSLSSEYICNDGLAAISIIEELGALVKTRIVSKKYNQVKISIAVCSSGIFKNIPKSNILNCRESALCFRMFAPIVALRNEQFELNASGSLLKRPIGMLEDLSQLNAICKTRDGFPPAIIKGPIKEETNTNISKSSLTNSISINCSESSQFVTGLLMALPLCKNDSIIKVSKLKSKPYVEMTISLLKQFGIKIINEDFQLFRIKGGQKYTPCKYSIEGDWSGAAFMLVAGAIAGQLTVCGLDMNSFQADKKIMVALERAGATIKIIGNVGAMTGNKIIIEKNKLNAFEFDANECPDLFPPLAALAANCKGTSIIRGTKRLKHKESDRAHALACEFAKLGIRIDLQEDQMKIFGGEINGGKIDSHGDHRIAMACAIAALNAKNKVKIKNPECVSKSYPEFFCVLDKLNTK